MPDGIRWVGLDVRARGSTIAVFDQTTGELNARRVTGRPHELVDPLPDVPRPARMVYEAGPTGYGLARRARALGIEMAVCAPGRTERRPGDRVKTDQRDAARLDESFARVQDPIRRPTARLTINPAYTERRTPSRDRNERLSRTR